VTFYKVGGTNGVYNEIQNKFDSSKVVSMKMENNTFVQNYSILDKLTKEVKFEVEWLRKEKRIVQGGTSD
jgi:RNA-binding protein YhbY